MAKLDRAALRYAKAAFDFLGDAKKAKSVSEELRSFSGLVSQNAELQVALTNEAFSTDSRVQVVKDLCEKAGLSTDAVRILSVLSENRRMMSAEAVADRLQQLCWEASDIAALEVESASELKAEDKKKIEDKFSKLLGKKVEARYQLAPNLLGGLRVTAAGRTYDGTLSGWLETMEEKLMGGYL